MAPERIESARAVLSGLVHREGRVLFLLVASLNHLILRVNLSAEPNLGSWPWILVVALFTTMLAIIIPPMPRFRRRT